MTEEAVALATFGQKSICRAIEQWPLARLTAANYPRTWALPDVCTIDSAQRAWRSLETHHESLRTGYYVSSDDVRQVLWQPAPPLPVVETDGTPESAAELTAQLISTPFQLNRERPWRAMIVTVRGKPVFLALALHHVAADGWATNVLQRDLLAVLAGDVPQGGGLTCRQIAENQRSPSWAGRREAAEAHWHGVLAEASPAPVLRADGSVTNRLTRYWTRSRTGALC